MKYEANLESTKEAQEWLEAQQARAIEINIPSMSPVFHLGLLKPLKETNNKQSSKAR